MTSQKEWNLHFKKCVEKCFEMCCVLCVVDYKHDDEHVLSFCDRFGHAYNSENLYSIDKHLYFYYWSLTDFIVPRADRSGKDVVEK